MVRTCEGSWRDNVESAIPFPRKVAVDIRPEGKLSGPALAFRRVPPQDIDIREQSLA